MAWWRYYTPKPAREVKGGIKAQSRRGAFATSWWGQRWITVLESFNIGERLNRGRTYARKGQVMDIDIETGAVRATVQGSRSRPYSVEVRFRPLSPAQWYHVVKELSSQFMTMAKLLAGEMPEDVEKVFAHAKLSLFPHKLGDLETDCTCPDWSNPCKHTAAVFYLLGEEFDRDPFLLFKLRGLTREELFEMLGYGPAAAAVLPASNRDGLAGPAPVEASPAASSFWGGEESLDDLLGEVRVPEVTAILPKRLGSFPFWRGKAPFLETLEPFYHKAASVGLDVLSGLGNISVTSPAIQEKSPPQSPQKAKKIPREKAPRQGKGHKKKPPGKK
jgi:uncharacterized Zn finger protein